MLLCGCLSCGTDARCLVHAIRAAEVRERERGRCWSEHDLCISAVPCVHCASRKPSLNLPERSSLSYVYSQGGFTGMSWAPAACAMKHDCCILAPDLRGHGLTSSSADTNADIDADADADADTRKGDHGDGDAESSDSDGEGEDGGGGCGNNALMSLESLTEDVTSLLVEIFTGGLLLQTRLPRTQRQQELEQQELEQDRSGSDGGSDPTIGCSATVRAGPPLRGPAGTSEHGEREDASRGTGAQIKDTPVVNSPGVVATGGSSGSVGGSCTSSPVKLLLVGHSLGGSIAVRVATAAEEVKRRSKGTAEVAGVVAVDVVEGTALTALDDMPEVRRGVKTALA